jgi:hypothetical protein
MNTKETTLQKLKRAKNNTNAPTYAILQIKKGDEYHYKRFENYKHTIREYNKIDLNDYDIKGIFSTEKFYKGNEETNRLLEMIYEIWNTSEHPIGFTGHSLSVSDIIAICKENIVKFHFCDSFGFRELENETTLVLD